MKNKERQFCEWLGTIVIIIYVWYKVTICWQIATRSFLTLRSVCPPAFLKRWTKYKVNLWFIVELSALSLLGLTLISPRHSQCVRKLQQLPEGPDHRPRTDPLGLIVSDGLLVLPGLMEENPRAFLNVALCRLLPRALLNVALCRLLACFRTAIIQ